MIPNHLIAFTVDNKEVYENFDWSSLKHEHLVDKIQKIVELVPNDVETIVDIGCGNGVITNVLGKQYKVTAVDRSENALSYVKTKKIKASADNIPLDNSSFDMVFSSELLEHLNDNTFIKAINEIKRLSKKYVFITVPNDENPDKLSIKCPNCNYIFNSPNHLRSFNKHDFKALFTEFEILTTFSYGKKVRYYNRNILNIKRKITPSNSWIPYYWIPKEKRKKSCPSCENQFTYNYKFNPVSTSLDLLNVLVSPKKPYWLFVLMKKK